MGVPSVFTLSSIATEFIEDERNAHVVPYRLPDRIADAVLRLLASHKLRVALVEQGRRDVEPRFALTTMTDAEIIVVDNYSTWRPRPRSRILDAHSLRILASQCTPSLFGQ